MRMAGPRAIELAPDGSRLLVREVTGLSVVDLRGERPPIAIRAAQLHAYAVVGDQIWVAAGAPATLTAYDAGGELLARTAIPERGPAPRMLPAPSGRLASWMGTGVALIAHDRGLAVTMLAADVDFALPLSPARTLVGNRHRLSLREQDVTHWTVPVAPGGWIADAALVLDGKAVAVACTQPPGAIVVVGLRDGAILHRLTVDHAVDIRFAPARGVALAYTRDGRVLLVDLRFGRVIVDHREPRAISQVGIDDAAGEIVLRLADRPDEIVRIAVADLMTAGQPTPSRAPVRTAPEPPAPPAPAANGHAEPASLVVAAPAAADPFSTGGLGLACEALPAWRAVERTTPPQTAMLHARQRELAIGITGVAIARAWDEGRLAYPQSPGLPFQSEVGGMTAGQRGLAAEELEAARRRLADAAKAALAGRRAVAPRLGPLDALGVELGLSPGERDLLLLIAAPSLWGETARLYRILAHDESRPLVDELLLAELLVDQAAPAQIARELDDDAPLVRHGIVRVQPGAQRPFLPLLVDPVVLRLLRGAALEPALDPIRVVSADRTFEELRIPARTKRRIAADLAHAARPLRIAIRGRVGSGRHALLAALAETSGRRLGVIDAAAVVHDARVRIGELGVALERAQLAGLLPCVDGLEQIASHDAVTHDRVREVLRRHRGPLAVRLPPEAPPLLEPGHVLIDLPALSLTDRLTCWERTLAHHGLRVGELGELADRYAVGPVVIERVVAELARTSAAIPAAELVPRLEAGIRQHLERRLGASATRVTRLASWSQVILPADIQDGLTELIARIKHRRIVFDAWGFHRVTSASRGVTALFQGGPGTGKTLVAGAIANELGMDLYRVDLAHVMPAGSGETEQHLARLFDAAEDGNTILLFEEIDTLFARRTADLEVEALLQRLTTFEGIAILTTSSGALIDRAFKRRLSLRLTFPFPGEDIREKLWRSHLPAAVPTAGAFDLAELARRYQLSGGYIRNAALRAAFLAAEEHVPLTQDHLERAIKAELRELDQDARHTEDLRLE